MGCTPRFHLTALWCVELRPCSLQNVREISFAEKWSPAAPANAARRVRSLQGADAVSFLGGGIRV